VQPLDDLLKTTPALYAAYPAGDWEAAGVNGRYPRRKSGHIPGISARFFAKRLTDKYNLDITKVEKLEDLEPWLEAVKTGEVTPISGRWSLACRRELGL